MPAGLDLSQRGGGASLSPRERAGVRGKQLPDSKTGSDKFHAAPRSCVGIEYQPPGGRLLTDGLPIGLVGGLVYGLVFIRMTNKMNIAHNPLRRAVTLSLLSGLTFALVNLLVTPASTAADASGSGDKVPLIIKLPQPAFKGTPRDVKVGPNVEPLSDKPRSPMMVPAGLKNMAKGAKMTSSDKNATADTLEKIVDGDKEAADESIVFLRKRTQWVQMDLGEPAGHLCHRHLARP